MFTLSMELDNAAFFTGLGTPLPEPEIARILHRMADVLEEGSRLEPGDGMTYTLRDINGNVVGRADLTMPEGEEV